MDEWLAHWNKRWWSSVRAGHQSPAQTGMSSSSNTFYIPVPYPTCSSNLHLPSFPSSSLASYPSGIFPLWQKECVGFLHAATWGEAINVCACWDFHSPSLSSHTTGPHTPRAANKSKCSCDLKWTCNSPWKCFSLKNILQQEAHGFLYDCLVREREIPKLFYQHNMCKVYMVNKVEISTRVTGSSISVNKH